MSSRLAILLFAASIVGCGAARSATPNSDRLTVERLYPLRAGSVWTYDVDTGQSTPVLAITRVLTHEGPRIEVSSGGEPVVYEVRADGLYRPVRGGYLLKPPFRTGATWDAGGGTTAEVVATGLSKETMAGSFTDCIEVTETGGESEKVVRTVYCPDVGPIEVESSMHMSLSGQNASVLGKLRGYDFSGALDAP